MEREKIGGRLGGRPKNHRSEIGYRGSSKGVHPPFIEKRIYGQPQQKTQCKEHISVSEKGIEHYKQWIHHRNILATSTNGNLVENENL